MDSVKLEWRRQFSTSRRVRVAVLAALATLALSFAAFLWWFAGAWIILPFAGLEIACAAVAFWWLERSTDDRDCIEVTETQVKIERERGRQAQRFVFNRGWLVTELKCDRMGGWHGLRVRQSGLSVELLEFLPVSEQHRALRDLRAALASRQFASRIN